MWVRHRRWVRVIALRHTRLWRWDCHTGGPPLTLCILDLTGLFIGSKQTFPQPATAVQSVTADVFLCLIKHQPSEEEKTNRWWQIQCHVCNFHTSSNVLYTCMMKSGHKFSVSHRLAWGYFHACLACLLHMEEQGMKLHSIEVSPASSPLILWMLERSTKSGIFTQP